MLLMMMILVMMIMMISLSLNISLSSLLFLSVHFLRSHQMMLKQTWNSKRKGWVEQKKRRSRKQRRTILLLWLFLVYLERPFWWYHHKSSFSIKSSAPNYTICSFAFFVTDFLAAFCAVFLDRRYVSCKKGGLICIHQRDCISMSWILYLPRARLLYFSL